MRLQDSTYMSFKNQGAEDNKSGRNSSSEGTLEIV